MHAVSPTLHLFINGTSNYNYDLCPQRGVSLSNIGIGCRKKKEFASRTKGEAMGFQPLYI